MTLFSIKQRSYRLKVRLLFTVIRSLFITQYAPLYASRDGNRQGTTPTEYIPETPDYGDPTMWFTRENDSNDTGADVQYIKPVVCRPCVMCINPVNWRTDATPATLAEPSPLVFRQSLKDNIRLRIRKYRENHWQTPVLQKVPFDIVKGHLLHAKTWHIAG